MRLIDADRLLSDRAKSTYYHLPNGDTAIPIIDIEHAPAVDAVEVVRCKDCKQWNPAFDREVSEYGVCQIRSQHIATKRDFFCSKGERRSDGR